MNDLNDLRDRIARLPAWARDHIKRLETMREPLLEEAAKARRAAGIAQERARRLSDSNEALLDILKRAGENGHDWSKLVVSILEGYGIYQTDILREDAI